MEFYAPLTGVLLSSDVFILSCWLINTWPAGIGVQKIYSLTDLYSYSFLYLVQGYAENLRLIDNDSSLVKMTLLMTKIIVSSSWQWVGERSPLLKGFLEKLIKTKMLSGPYLVLWVCILGENCAYTSLLRTLEGCLLSYLIVQIVHTFQNLMCFAPHWCILSFWPWTISFYKREERERKPSFFCWYVKEGGAGKSEMKTVCVIKELGQAATSLAPFGDVDEDGIQGASLVRKLVLPGRGATWKFVPAKAKWSPEPVIRVLSEKKKME